MKYFSEYVEQWFQDNGYSFEVIKRHAYKTKYNVSKNGISLIWTANDSIRDFDAGIKNFQTMFEMATKLQK